MKTFHQNAEELDMKLKDSDAAKYAMATELAELGEEIEITRKQAKERFEFEKKMNQA